MTKKRGTNQFVSRRNFIRGAGGVILGLPFLNAMSRSRALAQTVSFPKRLVIWYGAQGLMVNEYLPSGTPDAYRFEGELIKQIDAHKPKTLVLSGLNNESANEEGGNAHNAAAGHCLTGTMMQTGGNSSNHTLSGGHSIDFRIAQGLNSPAPLHLGVRPPWEVCYTGAGEPVSRQKSPHDLFDKLFAGQDPTSNGQQRIRAKRQSVLDATKANIKLLKARLGASDRVRLDGYLARVEEIERRLHSTVSLGASCAVPAPLSLGPSPDRLAAGWWTHVNRFHPYYDPDISIDPMIDLGVLALACNQTQVLTFTMGQQNRYHWLRDSDGNHIGYKRSKDGGYERDGSGNQIFGDWHQDYIHRLDSSSVMPAEYDALYDSILRVKRYEWQKFNRLLNQLDAIPEGDGTLLDNSLVLYCNEFGEKTHRHVNMPYLTVGGCGGAIRTGRWLKFNGEPHNRLFLSILRAFGLSDPSFGEARYSVGGPLSGVN